MPVRDHCRALHSGGHGWAHAFQVSGMNNTSIKNKVLLPIAITLLIAFAVVIIGINVVVRKDISNKAMAVTTTAQKLFSHQVEEDSGKIRLLLEQLAANSELQQSWLTQDRKRLHEQSLSLFTKLQHSQHITHFYYHQLDGINFLRVHNPERHGDSIERFTLREAKRQGLTVHGIELGPFATLTLRVVHPWMIDGRVTGFIELGEELPHITEHLKEVLGVELFLAIKKSFLTQEGWEEGRRMLGQAALVPWETITDRVVVDSTVPISQDNLATIRDTISAYAAAAVKTVTLAGHLYQVQKIPVYDVIGANLGDFHLLYDITAETSSLQRLTGVLLVTAILLGALLVLFFFYHLGKVEQAIVQDQQQIKQQHQEAQALNEQLKGEIVDRLQTQDRLERSYQTTETINKIQHLSLASDNLDQLLHDFIGCLVSLPWLSLEPQGAVFLIEEDPEVLVLKAFQGLSEILQQRCARLPFGTCLCGRAATSREVVFADCIDERHDISFLGMAPHGHYCIPILSGERQLLGVFTLYVRDGARRSERAEAILLAAASSVAGTIERLQWARERMDLETKLRQSQKMEAIGTLAGGIAHDFNNILTPILGYAELMRQTLPPATHEYHDLQIIIDGTYRAKDLVSQILLFSRQSEQEKKPVDVVLIAKQVIKLMKSSLPANIEIQQFLTPQRSMVMADQTQIYQVIMNLCTNAYQAMQEHGGVLCVALTPVDLVLGEIKDKKSELSPGSYLKIEVSDTGQGIDPTNLDKIFEPYFTTKAIGHGTGLGLAVVHGIVKSYGGMITVYSEPNKGASFHVYLPLIHSSGDISEGMAVVCPMPTGNERILAVDDREEIANYERELLTLLGYQVTSFTSSVAALEVFLAHPDDFDLVITDMSMPKMTGADLAQRILALRKTIPILLCTGFSELINQEKAKSIGIKGYIMKPIISRQFAQVIRDVLDATKMERERMTDGSEPQGESVPVLDYPPA